MAVTRTSAVADQIPEIWAADLYSQAEDLTFWHRFEGPEGSSMPVIRKDELEKEPGDTIRVDIVLALSGAGVTGDTSALEGNEEALSFRQNSFGVEALSHAVRWTKKAKVLMTHQMRQTALRQLAKWLAGKLDNDIFTAFTTDATAGTVGVPTNGVYVVGSGTGIDDLQPGDEVDLDSITEIKAYAQEEVQIEPLRSEGDEEFFGMVLDPYAAMHLKKSADYQQAQREAQLRGASNPLFRGALAMWDGVILFSNSRVPAADNAHATPVRVAQNTFFGAQALLRGYAYYPDWVEQEFDYGREIGVATYLIYGEQLNTFDLNATETDADATDDTAIGSIKVLSAAAAPTVP